MSDIVQLNKDGYLSDEPDMYDDSIILYSKKKDEIVKDKLNELSYSLDKDYLLDELMLSERHFDIFNGFVNYILGFISVYRSKIATDKTYKWSDILKTGFNASESRTLYWKRIMYLVMFLSLSIPYAYWVSLVPDLVGETGFESAYFKIFMSVINAIPFTCWLVYLLIVVKNKNDNTYMRIKLLKLSKDLIVYTQNELKLNIKLNKSKQNKDNDKLDEERKQDDVIIDNFPLDNKDIDVENNEDYANVQYM
jgi:hypothetical protein